MRSPRVRSAITNGGLPGGVSKCSAQGRRYADLMHELTAALGGELSFEEELRVRLAAGQFLKAEQLQADMLRGEAVDAEQLVRLSNAASRELGRLQAGRAGRRQPPGSKLQAHLAAKYGAPA